MHVQAVWRAACPPHSSAPPQPWICMQTKKRVHTPMFHLQRFKTKLFFFSFLVCLLQVIPKKKKKKRKEKKKKKLLALQISFPAMFYFYFFASMPFIFIAPFLHPPFPLSLITQSLFYHWCEREEDRREEEEEERKSGRWPTLYLSVFLFVCLSLLFSFFFFPVMAL